MERVTISTSQKTELVDITTVVQGILDEMRAQSGILFLYCPHTTAGLTVNENWDPDVKRDMLLTVDDHIAPEDARHRHAEGNSPAHVKSSLFGMSLPIFVEHGQLQLGRWQGIYFAEFDGPRHRQVWLKFLAE